MLPVPSYADYFGAHSHSVDAFTLALNPASRCKHTPFVPTDGADRHRFSDCCYRPLKVIVYGCFRFNFSFRFELKQQLCSIFNE